MSKVIIKYTKTYIILGEKMIKTYLKSYGYLFGIIIILSIILSIINYFANVSLNTIKLIIPILSMLISSIILGKNVKSKAYLEGLKFSIVYLIIITSIKRILSTPFNYKAIIMYLVLIFTSIIGSMIGINSKKE